MASVNSTEDIPISKIFLYTENPRHEPVESEAEAIFALCSKEDVLQIARDIARNGLSPLERLAVFPAGKPAKIASQQVYFCAEGNRRLCAIKLLSDPELAPAKVRKSFEKLATGWKAIKTVQAVVFKDFDASRVWLERIHNGAYGGMGRKPWTPDQKSRFDGENKNRSAQLLLDYAEKEGFITTQGRERKLTTVQRFVSNPLFREVLGYDTSDANTVKRTREKQNFDGILNRFIADLVDGKSVNSRMNKKDIDPYARALESLPEARTPRIEAQPLISAGPSRSKSKTKRPIQPDKAKKVRFEQNIHNALRDFKNEKLSSLYYSICDIELEHHTPIIAIGAWAFFETLTSCAGRSENISFEAFLDKNRLQNIYQLGSDSKSLRDALTRISSYGNTTKHHPVSVTFNGDQLNNDMVTLTDLILKCIAEAKAKNHREFAKKI